MGKVIKNIIYYKYLYILMLPGILFLIVFSYLPMWGIIIAFENYSPFEGITGSQWVGFNHFKDLFQQPYFFQILKNTVLISFYKLFFGFPIPIILALMINEVKNRYFKRFVQTVSYVPFFISWVIISGIIFSIFNPYYGLIEGAFSWMFGKGYMDISTDPRFFRMFLVLTSIWKTAGWGSILYLAALAGIDPHLYEAAGLDGANRWKQLFHITLPSMKNVYAIVFILSIGTLLSGDFEQIYLLAGIDTQLLNVADVFETYVYRTGILQFNFSFPTAVGLFQSFFAMILILGTNWFAKKFDYEGIW